MDKAKFQQEISSRLGDIFINHVTFNFPVKNMIPGTTPNSTIMDYDILYVEKGCNGVIIEIQVKFQKPDHPFVTIEIKGEALGFGYYVDEDPQNIVWLYRVTPGTKKALAKLENNLEICVQSIIDDLYNAYLNS